MECTVLTPDACHAPHIVAQGVYLPVLTMSSRKDFFEHADRGKMLIGSSLQTIGICYVTFVLYVESCTLSRPTCGKCEICCIVMYYDIWSIRLGSIQN